jgi:hypothetical protein
MAFAEPRKFKNGSYERIFTTGGPENGTGGYTNDYNTSASVAAESLEKFGVPDDLVQMVPSRVSAGERTYSSAVALREWFRDHNLAIHSFNVLTEGSHARRTQLLYKEAFGKNVTIGIIAVSNPDYDPKDWWRYSDGVREVIGESIAYIYAKFFFYPSASLSAPDTRESSPMLRKPAIAPLKSTAGQLPCQFAPLEVIDLTHFEAVANRDRLLADRHVCGSNSMRTNGSQPPLCAFSESC